MELRIIKRTLRDSNLYEGHDAARKKSVRERQGLAQIAGFSSKS